jgi:hypothetical protein
MSYPIVNTVKLYAENDIFTGIYTTDAVYKTAILLLTMDVTL